MAVDFDFSDVDAAFDEFYEEVKEAAAKLGTDIKIYPVKTLEDAIEILQNL